VAQVAAAHGLPCLDLRGLPVADSDVAGWLPPEFLPRPGRVILFLDEINLAASTLQGVAQQLVLDRRVSSYALPDACSKLRPTGAGGLVASGRRGAVWLRP
jgi:MoxR-like ATPase